MPGRIETRHRAVTLRALALICLLLGLFMLLKASR